MHADSFKEMQRIIDTELRHFYERAFKVLDVGSRCVNEDFPHTYRELMPAAWNYLGIDLEAGANVDRIMLGPYRIHPKGELYDLVVSGQCLEHVENPFRLVAEIARVLKPGGLAILAAPWRHDHIHNHPVDCWRILPDGMKSLLAEAGLATLRTYTVRNDTWGIAEKPNSIHPPKREQHHEQVL